MPGALGLPRGQASAVHPPPGHLVAQDVLHLPELKVLLSQHLYARVDQFETRIYAAKVEAGPEFASGLVNGVAHFVQINFRDNVE